MDLRTCVHPSGNFVYGIHRPSYCSDNLRENDYIKPLGWFENGEALENRVNFPPGSVEVPEADPVFEVPNAFPFRGVTYILKRWAERNAEDPSLIRLPKPSGTSFSEALKKWMRENRAGASLHDMFSDLPEPVKLSVAECSTDPADLEALAELSCCLVHDEETGRPAGLRYRTDNEGESRPLIYNKLLYEIVANNPFLPAAYKEAMVLRPGVQGDSPIVGESADRKKGTHVFEYLRENSYIPGGHYAANNADDAVRYRLSDLSAADMRAMRHLYYQRSFVRLARELGIRADCERRSLSRDELENLRLDIKSRLSSPKSREKLSFNRTLWGWNFGFDYAPTGYRLHASHQQVHQQYAMVPAGFETSLPHSGLKPYACGDLVAEFIEQYRRETGVSFFDAYIKAILGNRRMDGRDRENSIVVYSDDNVLLFVPKAQTSQWEVQLMTRAPVGSIVEADQSVRDSLDYGMLTAVHALEAMGAAMITSIEYSKALDSRPDNGQRLLYSFLPRLPESPGAFSEAQLRWINGHYPEDFAASCRIHLSKS